MASQTKDSGDKRCWKSTETLWAENGDWDGGYQKGFGGETICILLYVESLTENETTLSCHPTVQDYGFLSPTLLGNPSCYQQRNDLNSMNIAWH